MRDAFGVEKAWTPQKVAAYEKTARSVSHTLRRPGGKLTAIRTDTGGRTKAGDTAKASYAAWRLQLRGTGPRPKFDQRGWNGKTKWENSRTVRREIVGDEAKKHALAVGATTTKKVAFDRVKAKTVAERAKLGQKPVPFKRKKPLP